MSRIIYEELDKLYPNDKVLQTELIKLYFLSGDANKGFSKFAKSLSKDSLTYEEKLQLGDMYYRLMASDSTAVGAAKNIFLTLSADYSDKWIVFFYLGAIEFAVKNKSQADIYLARAESLADTSVTAYYQIGYSYFEHGINDKSKIIFEKGINKFPDNSLLNYLFGLSVQREGNNPLAIQYFEKAVKLSPEDVQILGTLAMAYNTEKRFKEADETYEKALIIDYDNTLILNNYAYNLAVRGEKLSKALAMSRRVIEKESGNANYLDTYGWIYYKMGDYENACFYLEKSLAKNAGSAVVNDHMGDACYAMDDFIKAKKYWTKALELSPNSIEIKNKLNNLK